MRIRRRFDGDLAIVVSPSRAALMLDCGEARLYELLKAGELRSYKDGKSRKILVASVHAYIERKLAEAAAAVAA
jgi:excisionase family DNA binding protein